MGRGVLDRIGRWGAVWVLGAVLAAGSARAADGPLRVGTKSAPPFAVKAGDGSWGGISIELWRRLAERLGLEFELHEYELKGLLDAVESGEVDAAVAALSVTAEREARFDFTHPFYTTGLGIAVAAGETKGWLAVLERLLSGPFLQVVGGLSLLLFVVGVLIWLLERRRNPGQFGGNVAQGIGSGFWWSAVTMTTVGYGDKAPVTFWGRAVGLVWMFAGLLAISSFTAAMTTALTVGQLEMKVRGPEDLPRVVSATVPGSTSRDYLTGARAGFREYPSPLEGLRGLTRGEVGAVVYDAPMLRYLVKEEFQGALRVLPTTFLRQDYAIALPSGSGLREPLNRALLAVVGEDWWDELVYRYLGR